MTNAQAFKKLKSKCWYIRKEMPNAFGDSSSRNGWFAICIPNDRLAEVEKTASEMSIKLFSPLCSNIYGTTLRLINTDHQAKE